MRQYRHLSLAALVLVASSSTLSFAQDNAPKVIIETSAGNLSCTLYPKQAPIGVANFIGLATGEKTWVNPKTGATMQGVPLYDGTIFHRVIPEFMIQGGDPMGNGRGGSGDRFAVEWSTELSFDQPGRLAYANAGPNTNQSQFFITEVATPFLDGKYTIFGQCDAKSVALVKRIARLPRNGADYPDQPVTIKHITVIR